MTEKQLSQHYKELIIKFRKLQKAVWDSPMFEDSFSNGEAKEAMRAVIRQISPFSEMVSKVYEPQLGKLVGQSLRDQAYDQLWKKRKKRARKSKKAAS